MRVNSLLRLPAAGALVLAAWPAAARAGDLTFVSTGDEDVITKVQLIDNSRLGCGQGIAMWTASSGGQCAFDTATHGAKISAGREGAKGSFEAYATIARATSGAFTPDDLLTESRNRSAEATDFMMFGMKASAFDKRLKVTAEFARTHQVVDQLRDQDWALADWNRKDGTSASVKLDAMLADRPGLKWSMTAEYRSVSDGYSTGRSSDLMLYTALPGTRLAVSTKARLGQFGLSAGMEQSRTPFGSAASRRAGFDMDGLSLRLVSRDTQSAPIEGSTLLGSDTHSTGAYLDIDSELLASTLIPGLMDQPAILPTMISISYKSGEAESRYEGLTQQYRKTSIGVDGSWTTPLGQTDLSYWRDQRIGLTGGASSSTGETFSVSQYVTRGHWRFGLDASLYRTRGEDGTGYADKSLSFGQSVAYSVEDGPEFSLRLGQDRGEARRLDDSYFSSDRYSSITASLDLSRYLQKRFERPDLRLTLDYRKAVDRTDETDVYDSLVERWVDGNRRQGLLMSFGMKL
jgi:hypothetical protein